AANKRYYLVAPRLRTHKLRMVLIMLQKPVGECGELEVVVLFADCLRDTSAVRAGIPRLGSLDVSLVENAILAGVSSLVDDSLFLQPLPQCLHALFVTRLCGADEIVVRDVHPVKQLAKLQGHLICKLLRGDAGRLGRTLDLLSMLIGPG